MKRRTFLMLIVILLTSANAFPQINGQILLDDGNFSVVKLWGSHYDRGYAYGYLMADEIEDIYEGYLKQQFGSALPLAKQIIQQGQMLTIDSTYIYEAQGIYQGMVAAGVTIASGDYLDILVANTFLDISGLLEHFGSKSLENGCSSLMTWGEAAAGTADSGQCYISRHLDWDPHMKIINNQVMVIHIPSEPDEQPWAMIGFAGMMSCLSGVNAAGVSAFQHMLSDYNETATINAPYVPVWFALRDALEKADYNGDGKSDVNDVRAAIAASVNGFSNGYIVTSLALADQQTDTLIAMVAEVCPSAPTHTYRYVDYPDNIPGKNLYAANYEIKRNDHHHYCNRYNAVAASFIDSAGISRFVNWEKMRLYSNSGAGNIQFMQFCPNDMELLLARHNGGHPAYQNTPDTFYLNQLFSPPGGMTPLKTVPSNMRLFPNPAHHNTTLELNLRKRGRISIMVFNMGGMLLQQFFIADVPDGLSTVDMPLTGLPEGIYFVRVEGDDFVLDEKLIKNKR